MFERTKAPDRYDAYWLDQELRYVEEAFRLFDVVKLVQTNVAPAKPRLGEIRLADGTNWNPGAGAGFYGYHSGAWNKLG